jgi:ribosome-associated protein
MTSPTYASNASSAVKKDTQKLQRAIVDGLEDVKAQDIVVFDTEHLSALFERVIVASGTSNRQTKALAASVRDAVKAAGFPAPRVEGETNGEWIIVDCGAAVAHIMQPNFRQYYHLEELWGEKPVRLKLGAAKPARAVSASEAESAKATAKKAAVPAKDAGSLRRSSAAKKGVQEAFPSKAQVKKDAAKSAAKTAAKPAPKPAAKTATRPASKTAVKQPAAKRVVVGKPAAKRAVKPATKPATQKAATIRRK